MKKTLILLAAISLAMPLAASTVFHLPLKGDFQTAKDSKIQNIKIYNPKNLAFGTDGRLKFTGDGYLGIAPTQKDLCIDTFTVTFWLRLDPTENFGRQSVFRLPGGNGHNAGGRMFMDRSSGSAVLHWGMKTDQGSTKMQGGPIFENRFTFVAMTIMPGKMSLSIDNQQVAQVEYQGKISYDLEKNSSLTLGFSHFPELIGSIGDFCFYNEVLSAEVLGKIYSQQQAGYPAPVKQVQVKDQATAPNGLRYYPDDKLYTPAVDPANNLIANPSFETGLDYWLAVLPASSLKPEFLSITTKGHSGKKAAVIKVWNGEPAAHLNSFSIQVTPGGKYSVSFAARSEKPVNMSLRIVGAQWPKRPLPSGEWPFTLSKTVRLNEQWQRFEYSFSPPDNIAYVSFIGPGNPTEDNEIHIDSVQLVSGPAKPFAEPPFTAGLESGKLGHIFMPDEPVKVNLIACTPNSPKGKVSLTGYDFLKNKFFTTELNYQADASGYSVLSLDLTGKLKNGINIIQADYTLADGKTYTAFQRIGVMKPAVYDFKHKNFFAISAISAYPNAEDSFKRLRDFGFGSVLNFGNVFPKIWNTYADKYDILVMTSVFAGGRYSRTTPRFDIKYNYDKLTGQNLDLIVEGVKKTVADNPHVKYWKTVNEIGENHVQPNFMELARRSSEAIKQANPQAMVLSPDQTNIYPNNGARTIEKLFEAGMGNFIDILSIHPYRPHPDAFDLDSDLANIFRIVDKAGFKGPVWNTESMNYTRYQLPAFGWEVSKHFAADAARNACFSYDLGFGEQLSTAYNARSWIITMKYAKRMPINACWQINSANLIIDAQSTPRANGYMVNTLVDMLGNSEFVEDLDISDCIRGYVFKDGGRNVAALWNRDWDIDLGKREPTSIYIPFAPEEATLVDLMNNPVKFSKGEKFAVKSAPVFFVSSKLDTAEFARRLREVQQEGGQVSTIAAAETFASAERINLTLTNRLEKNIAGDLKYTVNGKTVSGKNMIKGKESIQLSAVIPADAQMIDTEVVFTASPKEIFTYNQQYMLLKANSKGIKFPSKPIVFKPLKNALPPEATLFAGWDQEFLNLKLEVKNCTFKPVKDRVRFWQHDSIQIYIDTLNTAKPRRTKHFDNDDYAYGIYNQGDDKLAVFREVVPEWQLSFLNTGNAPEIKSTLKHTADGYIVELAIPAAALPPIVLSENNSFGFSVLINHSDGTGRRALSLMPEPVEPYGHQDQWPTLILTK